MIINPDELVRRNGGRITPVTLRPWALLGRLNTGLIEIVDPASQE
jgi:hypothetical protein